MKFQGKKKWTIIVEYKYKISLFYNDIYQDGMPGKIPKECHNTGIDISDKILYL